jgi:hypothetical protein
MPSSTLSSSTRKPSISGETSVSSRATSEPDTPAVSTKSATDAFTTETTGASTTSTVEVVTGLGFRNDSSGL